MPERDIAKDRQMCEAATPGPWEWDGSTLIASSAQTVLEVRQLPENAYPEMQLGTLVMPNKDADKRFIAESRTALPHYEERVTALEVERDHGRAMLDVAVALLSQPRVPCPPVTHCPGVGHASEHSPSVVCGKCIRDYLDAKAKEAGKR